MLSLPDTYRPFAIDMRGFGDTEPKAVDATRGLRDYADDLAATMAALGLEAAHLVGWSMGGGVVMQLLRDNMPVSDKTTGGINNGRPDSIDVLMKGKKLK